MKGSVTDLSVLSIILLAVGISFLFSLAIYNGFESQTMQIVQGNDFFNSTSEVSEGIQSIDSKMRFNYFLIDKLFLIIFVILAGLMLWLARGINTHPFFFIISVFAFMMTILVTWVAQNIYYYFASNSNLSAAANDLPSISTLLNNLPLVITLLFILLTVVMYVSKSENSLSWGLTEQ